MKEQTVRNIVQREIQKALTEYKTSIGDILEAIREEIQCHAENCEHHDPRITKCPDCRNPVFKGELQCPQCGLYFGTEGAT